jgi:poly(A) polymerase
VEVTEDADHLGDRLKLSNAERERLARAATADSHGLSPPGDAAAIKAMIYRHGAEAARDVLLIAWARAGAGPGDPQWRAKLTLANTWQAPKLPVSGKDVVALGVAPGPRVGELLARVEDWWIEAGFPDDRGQLLSRLESAVRGG